MDQAVHSRREGAGNSSVWSAPDLTGCQSKAVALEELQVFDLLILGILLSRHDRAFAPQSDPIQRTVNIC